MKLVIYNVQWTQGCIQSESVFTTCGSSSTGSLRWMRKDTCIPCDLSNPIASWSTWLWMLSFSNSDGKCCKEACGCGEVGGCWRLKMRALPGLREQSGTGWLADTKDPLRCGTVAMEKLSSRGSSTASHCPQHTVSVAILHLPTFLFSSACTCTQRGW